jgi:hypothetical protein
MLTLIVSAVFCDWMVSTGAVGALMSTNRSDKVIAMWMPIMPFFYMGFENSVVNMVLFPIGLMLGGDFTIGDYSIWNEIPTAIGNLVGGLTLVGLVIYATHVKDRATARHERQRQGHGQHRTTPLDVLSADTRTSAPRQPRRLSAPDDAFPFSSAAEDAALAGKPAVSTWPTPRRDITGTSSIFATEF